MKLEKFNYLADENIRIDKFIAAKLDGVTRSHIQKLIDEGNVTVDGKSVKSNIAPWRYSTEYMMAASSCTECNQTPNAKVSM